MLRKSVVLRSVSLAAATSAAVLFSAQPSSAQYRGYGYSYNGAPDYYYGGGGGPAYEPFYYPDQRPAYRPYAPAYAPQRGTATPNGALPYVDPADEDRGGGREPGRRASDYDLGEAANVHTAVEVENPTRQPAGTVVIDTASRHLYLVQQGGRALQYGIGVGRQGFAWHGTAKIERKAEWPGWTPPRDMVKRRPDLPDHMAGGIDNPLGARAMYLFQGNRDTLFRIHGTNEPDTIGKAVSSGCIRMNNADVIDLYQRVPVGTRVVVL